MSAGEHVSDSAYLSGDATRVSGSVWAHLVAAEFSVQDAGAARLLEMGIDPADAFVVDAQQADPTAAGAPGGDGSEPGLANSRPGWGRSSFADMAPGLSLAFVLDELAAAELTTYELADVVTAWERMASWVQARQAEAIAALARRPEMQPGRTAQGGDGGRQFGSLNSVPVTAGDLCMVWPWIKPQAERLVSTDVTLVERFPETHRALAAGRIDVRRASIVIDELNGQDDDVAALVEAAVLPHVHSWTSVKLRRVIRRLIHELAPHTAKKRHREAREKRDVFIEPAPDGMAWLHAYLPAEQAAAIMAVLNAAADAEKNCSCSSSHTCQGHPSDEEASECTSDPKRDTSSAARRADHGCNTRTPAQRRADTLAALAWSSLSTGYLGGSGCAHCGSPFGTPLAEQHGRPVSVHLTMAFSTWVGLDEHPAELEGYGPVDADVGRKLAAAGVWRWLLTDPVGGHAIDYGRIRYTRHKTWSTSSCCVIASASCPGAISLPIDARSTTGSNIPPGPRRRVTARRYASPAMCRSTGVAGAWSRSRRAYTAGPARPVTSKWCASPASPRRCAGGPPPTHRRPPDHRLLTCRPTSTFRRSDGALF